MPKAFTRQHEKIDPKVLWRLLGLLKPYKWRLITVLTLTLLANLDTIINSVYLEVLIDKYIVPLTKMPAPDYRGLSLSILTMAVIYMVGVLISFLSEYLIIPMTQGTLRSVREQMFVRLQSLPLKYFDENKFGDIMSRFTNDTDALEQMIGRSLPNMLMSLAMIVMVAITMITRSGWLTLVAAAVIVVSLFLSSVLLKLAARYFATHQKILGETNAYIEEIINGQKVVKVFSHEAHAQREFERLNDELAVCNRKANTYANVLMPLMMNFGNLQYVLLGIVGGMMVVRGVDGMTLGLIAAFMQLSRNLTRPLAQVSGQINSVVVALAGAGRIFALLDELPESDDGQITLVDVAVDKDGQLVESKKRTERWAWKHPDGTLTELRGDVRFNHVTFAYIPGKEVLHDVTFFCEPGEKIAFVGHTGAGKTTITNLLNRFYDIDEGEILLDGINIREISKKDLRRSLGIVLQDTNLFTGTVAENIAYGHKNVAETEITAAAKTASADAFISHLPEKYETKLSGDGNDLSQGQRQLLSIARAAILDPPVLILDEATSSIDTRTEKYIQAGMDNMMKGRTTLVIAHRLSTVREARAIIVMDHGKIIESGSHEKLMAQKGVYYQLYTGAFELE